MLHLVLMLLHSSNLDQEMYDLHEEGLVRGRLSIHQLLPKCDHQLILVHHLINSQYHPLLDQEVYGLEGGGTHTRGTRHTSVLRDAPSTNISLPLIEETPITPMEVSSTPPVVPHVASSP